MMARRIHRLSKHLNAEYDECDETSSNQMSEKNVAMNMRKNQQKQLSTKKANSDDEAGRLRCLSKHSTRDGFLASNVMSCFYIHLCMRNVEPQQKSESSL